TALPAAAAPFAMKSTAVVRTSGLLPCATALATVAAPLMPPTVMAAPAHPAGKRAGSMLMRLTRVRTPSVRASPVAGEAAATVGFTPPWGVRVARRIAPRQMPPEQTSAAVVALPSLHGAALFRFSHPAAGGVQKSVVHTFRSSQLRAAPTQVPVRV